MVLIIVNHELLWGTPSLEFSLPEIKSDRNFILNHITHLVANLDFEACMQLL